MPTNTPATDDTGSNFGRTSKKLYGEFSLAEISGTKDSQITIKDLTSASWIGQSFLKRTNINLFSVPRPLQQITIKLNISKQYFLDINSYFQLTFEDEGWVNKIFEVMKITIDNDQNLVSIVAFEVDVNL